EHEKRDNWLLIKHRDEYATDSHGDAILEEDKSVASGRGMDEISRGKGRKPTPFMLKKSGRADAGWNSNRDFDVDPNARNWHDRTSGAKAKPEKPEARLRGRAVPAMPEFVDPELARLVDRPPSGPAWGHEIKLDGYRMQMRVEDGAAELRTRKGLNWTDKFQA